MKRGNVTFIAPSTTQQRLAIAHEIAPSRCLVIRPGVQPSCFDSHRDTSLRADLGFTNADFILLAPGESNLASGHEHAMWATVILEQLDPNARLLLWGRGPRAEAVTLMPAALNLPRLVTLAEQKLRRPIRFEDLLGVADVCLVTPTGVAPVLPVATAMAAGIPIISSTTAILSETLHDNQTALMVPKPTPRALVQRLVDLREDPALRKRITTNCRASAIELFSVPRMLKAYRDASLHALAQHPPSNRL